MSKIAPRTLSGFMELLPAPQQQMERIMEILRRRHNLRLSLLKRCGHVCNLQLPQEFNSISMEFLNENLLPETGTT